jgi:hypothetical protein
MQRESNVRPVVLSGSCYLNNMKACTPSGASYAATFSLPSSRTNLRFNALNSSPIRSDPPKTKEVSENPSNGIADSISKLMEASERSGFFVGPSIGSSWRGTAKDSQANSWKLLSNLPSISVSNLREGSRVARREEVRSHREERSMNAPGTGPSSKMR